MSRNKQTCEELLNKCDPLFWNAFFNDSIVDNAIEHKEFPAVYNRLRQVLTEHEIDTVSGKIAVNRNPYYLPDGCYNGLLTWILANTISSYEEIISKFNKIPWCMFANNRIDNIVLPEHIDHINNWAFCEGVFNRIIIQNPLVRIEISAFADCDIKEIHYAGTRKEWNEYGNLRLPMGCKVRTKRK